MNDEGDHSARRRHTWSTTSSKIPSYQLSGPRLLFLPSAVDPPQLEEVGYHALAVRHSFFTYASATFPGHLELVRVLNVLILIFWLHNFHCFN